MKVAISRQELVCLEADIVNVAHYNFSLLLACWEVDIREAATCNFS